MSELAAGRDLCRRCSWPFDAIEFDLSALWLKSRITGQAASGRRVRHPDAVIVRYDMTGVGLPDLSNSDLAGFDVGKVTVLNMGGRTFNVRELYSSDEGIRAYTLQLAGEGAVVGFNCALSTSVLPGFYQTATSTISVCSGAYKIGFPAAARQFVVNGNTVNVGNNRVYAFRPDGGYSVVR